MARPTFGTAINCIDGRIQLPVMSWVREVLSVDYVDLITQPGPERLLADQAELAAQLIKPRVGLSVTGHGSPVLVLAAHHDCLANPVSEAAHREHLQRAMRVLLSWDLGVKVLAVWVNAAWQIEVVQTRSPTA